MADVESYAAFWHHRTAGGDFLDIRDRQIELTPPGDPRTTNGHQDTIAYDIDQRTQLWIGGARRNVGEASTLLQKGVRIYVADAGVKAYAIFDQRSWRAFAKHELPLVKNVIHCGSRSVNARPVRCQ
jgi:hypothetical protein